ncbi:MAG: fatty-acid desaturase [Crocinitomicaceae bacterium]|jgi:fatty-acid desaturase
MNIPDFLVNGVLDFSAWQIVLYTLIMTHISIISITVYLHRAMAHRAMDIHPALAHFFRFWCWFTMATVTKEWIAVHRKHHAKCETDEDPHSPVRKGLKTVLLGGAELYQTEISKEETINRYGKGCPETWVDINIYEKNKNVGITILGVMSVVLFGPIGLTVWAVQMLWQPVHAAGIINGVGHVFGYRNFECADASRNITPLAIWIGGEELHNNHHTYPNSAKLSVKAWEFDIGWMYIRMFQILGLVKNVRKGPVAHVNVNKTELDLDAAMAAANNRFQIMAKFYQTVIKPVVKDTRSEANAKLAPVMRRAKKLLTRDDSLMTDQYRSQLAELIEYDEMVEKVYQMKQDLQKVWKKRSASRDELLHAMQAWCKEAEASGIHALEEFAASLKQYSTKMA